MGKKEGINRFNGIRKLFFREFRVPSGCVLKGSRQVKSYLKWKNSNRYAGKYFSILGDSISTLEGFNPPGYNVFYADEICKEAGVFARKDTWWGQVIDFVGGELLVNNSWSGSRVTGLPDREELFPSGCSDERTSALHIGVRKPDVILIYLGTNDWGYGAMPELPDTASDERDNYRSFDFAYDRMLKKLKRNYPGGEIWCCTLSESYISKHPEFRFPHRYAGTHIEVYNDIIRSVSWRNDCKLIDLYNYKMPYDSLDGSHPTRSGMCTIATAVIRAMLGAETDTYMDCDRNPHEYVISEQYTGGTRYVCRICGKVKHESLMQQMDF